MTRPRKTLKASEIIDYIEDPNVEFSVFRLEEEAPIKELIQALQTTTNPEVQYVIAYALGRRRAKSAVGMLVDLLNDSSSALRAEAADALGKIADPKTGKRLLSQFLHPNEVVSVRQLLASAVGATGYRPAIPFLIEALSDDDPMIGGGAAWSLGKLQAIEATELLKQALAKEADSYPRQQISDAIDKISLLEDL